VLGANDERWRQNERPPRSRSAGRPGNVLAWIAADKRRLTGARVPPQETLHDRGNSPNVDIALSTVR
jgi:hypothetical protein